MAGRLAGTICAAGVSPVPRWAWCYRRWSGHLGTIAGAVVASAGAVTAWCSRRCSGAPVLRWLGERTVGRSPRRSSARSWLEDGLEARWGPKWRVSNSEPLGT